MQIHRQYHRSQGFDMDDDLAMEAMEREKRKIEQQYEDHNDEQDSDISTGTDSEDEETCLRTIKSVRMTTKQNQQCRNTTLMGT